MHCLLTFIQVLQVVLQPTFARPAHMQVGRLGSIRILREYRLMLYPRCCSNEKSAGEGGEEAAGEESVRNPYNLQNVL